MNRTANDEYSQPTDVDMITIRLENSGRAIKYHTIKQKITNQNQTTDHTLSLTRFSKKTPDKINTVVWYCSVFVWWYGGLWDVHFSWGEVRSEGEVIWDRNHMICVMISWKNGYASSLVWNMTYALRRVYNSRSVVDTAKSMWNAFIWSSQNFACISSVKFLEKLIYS